MLFSSLLGKERGKTHRQYFKEFSFIILPWPALRSPPPHMGLVSWPSGAAKPRQTEGSHKAEALQAPRATFEVTTQSDMGRPMLTSGQRSQAI